MIPRIGMFVLRLFVLGLGFGLDCAGILWRVCWHEGCFRTLPRPFRCFLLLVRFLIVAPLSSALQGAGSRERYLCVCIRVCLCVPVSWETLSSLVSHTNILGSPAQWATKRCPNHGNFYFCSFVAQLPFLDLYYDLPKNARMAERKDNELHTHLAISVVPIGVGTTLPEATAFQLGRFT